MQFTKAVRKKVRLRLALSGPAGAGKSWGALTIAKGIGGRIAVIDTERGSASLYSHLCDFDTLELTPPYSPERFVEAMKAAEKAGYDVLIVDSMTHEWNGIGGCLELNDSLATAKFKGNTWAAWNVTTPRHRAFVDAILQSPCHVICTLRSKTDTEQVEENGRKKVVKLGMKSEQRDGTDYEFTVVLDIQHDQHIALATKDRTELFRDPHKITEETGRRLLDWLNSGVDVPPPKTPVQRHATAIEEAESLEELKIAFAAVNQDPALTADQKLDLAKLKDERKAALTTSELNDTPAERQAREFIEKQRTKQAAVA